MGISCWTLAALLLLLQLVPRSEESTTRRLPNGKSQDMAILKDDFEKSKKDIAEIIELARGLEEEIEKTQGYVVDLRSIEKTEEIEKLAKRIRGRLKRVR
jgi:hypothetical protein